jgi:diphosphomevalonate decarboxylase
MSNPQPGLGLATCSPSLALIKYWGKADSLDNLPATPSLAVTLAGLKTATRVFTIPRHGRTKAAKDLVIVNQIVQDSSRFIDFFDHFREQVGQEVAFWAESVNNFPTAAGLASSSSGFAALALAADQALNGQLDITTISALARRGSASAARSLYGGFTVLPASAHHSTPLYPASHWPELRVIIVRVSEVAKDTSSRSGMESTRCTSPYYAAWLSDAQTIYPQALQALEQKDLEALGHYIRLSFMRMFGTMLAADPPILYWQADSVGVLQMCANLRNQGIWAYETMDAGPQVKIFCLEHQVDTICQALGHQFKHLSFLVDHVGEGPQLNDHGHLLPKPHPHLTQAAASLGISLDDMA